MLKIKFKEGDQHSPIYAGMRESVLQSVQEELCSVIEGVGIEPDPKNHHQISEALTLIEKIQDRSQTFSFEPKVREENLDRALTFYSDFTLDSSQHQAVSFKLAVSEKQGDEFTLQYESIFRLSFQQKSARWVIHTMGGGMSVNHYAYTSSPTELNCRRATHHPASFFMDVTLDERLAITSPTMAFLKPTQITFSQFQFVRRIYLLMRSPSPKTAEWLNAVQDEICFCIEQSEKLAPRNDQFLRSLFSVTTHRPENIGRTRSSNMSAWIVTSDHAEPVVKIWRML